jgi:hypothetical protein
MLANMDDTEKNLSTPAIPGVGDVATEFVSLSSTPMKLVAKKTVNAYQSAFVTATVAVPLVLGGPSTISQTVAARKSNEHVPSQSPVVIWGENVTVVVTSTSSPSGR